MSTTQMALEYLLVYCTSHGLTAIGEPPLAKTYQPVGESLLQTSRNYNKNYSDPGSKDAMPVWIMFGFLSLATAKYLLSFTVWYVFQVISTVIIVASTPIKTVAAANALKHPDSHRAHIDTLVKAMRGVKAFKAMRADRLKQVSVDEVRQDLKRRDTMKQSQSAPEPGRTAVGKAWYRLTRLACFRGFSAYLMMAIPQWYLGVAIDFFLSGQPSELKLGYGSTSIVLATIFGGGFAIWTHYTITPPRRKKIFDHFPKGPEVLMELWPLTASWAVAEQLAMSGPLALSRSFRLKHYAFDVDSWNTLDELGQKTKIFEFGLVFLLYLTLVAFVSIPATMILRRVHASMLSDEDLAIVPFHRGDRSRLHPYDERSRIRKPGLTISQAWATVTWDAYFRVLFVYCQYFAINQLVQLSYWSANWKLHQVFDVDKYAPTNLPCSPVGKVLPFAARNVSHEAYRGFLHPNPHPEL